MTTIDADYIRDNTRAAISVIRELAENKHTPPEIRYRAAERLLALSAQHAEALHRRSQTRERPAA